MLEALLCSLVLVAASDDAYLDWVAEPVERTELPPTAGQRHSADELAALAAAQPTPPYVDLISAVRAQRRRVGRFAARRDAAGRGAPRWRCFIRAAGCPRERRANRAD